MEKVGLMDRRLVFPRAANVIAVSNQVVATAKQSWPIRAAVGEGADALTKRQAMPRSLESGGQ